MNKFTAETYERNTLAGIRYNYKTHYTNMQLIVSIDVNMILIEDHIIFGMANILF